MKKVMSISSVLLVMVGILIGLFVSQSSNRLMQEAESAESTTSSKWSPTQPSPSLDVYYPGTEALKPDEMRVIACGTGMPMPRLKQAAACFVIELGNGDKFIFDMGNGSFERIHALGIPLDY
ncbi:MAG: hypothetical protein ACYSWP_16460, partial [Planctomycetota bacterium]